MYKFDENTIINNKWFSPSGEEYSINDIASLIKETESKLVSRKIHVGTDSWQGSKKRKDRYDRFVTFISVICLQNEGAGVRYFFSKERLPRKEFHNLQSKLVKEVSNSLEIANHLRELGIEIECVHIDVNNQSPNHASYHHSSMLQNYVKAYGFKFTVKPDSWAAFAVADRHTR